MRFLPLALIIAFGAPSCAESEGAGAGAPAVGVSAPQAADDLSLGAVPRWQLPAPTSQDYGPYDIQLGDLTFATLKRVALAAEGMPLLPTGIGGTIFTYSLFVEATQTIELFSLHVPDSPAGQQRPLLTAFHGFGTSHRDIDVRTRFFLEADERDWFLVAPLQRSLADPTGSNFDISYASAQSQLHVEAVIRFVLDHYDVDRDRLYGVGFSMGGGNALSYAARHRDRASGAFAAVVNHTGSVALTDVYATLPAGSSVIGIMELIFGGPPSATPFRWQQSSLIELDGQGQILGLGVHMAQNLGPVPVQTWFNSDDQQVALVNQSMRLAEYMQGVQGADHSLVEVTGGVSTCDSSQHCWDTLDQTLVCDWLAQQSLNRQPAAGSIIADRSGTWEYFDLKQELGGEFSSLTYAVDPDGNAIAISVPQNLARIRTSLGDLGLDPASAVKFTLEGFGPEESPFILTGITAPPASVLREGLTLPAQCSFLPSGPRWCYDALDQTLTFEEDQVAPAHWRVQF